MGIVFRYYDWKAFFFLTLFIEKFRLQTVIYIHELKKEVVCNVGLSVTALTVMTTLQTWSF